VLLGLLHALGDGGRHLLGLAVAHADRAVAVADDDQRGEGEPASALHDLGHAVDGDDPLDVSGLLGCGGGVLVAAVTTVATLAALTAAATRTAAAALLGRHQESLFSVFW
jgi:hypothetical protein